MIGDLLSSEFENRGKYDFIEAQKIYDIIDAKNFTPKSLTQYTTALEIGNLLNADGVIVGSVSEYGSRSAVGGRFPAVGFSTRLIDVATGEIVWSFTACNENGIKGTLSVVATKVVEEVIDSLNSELIKKGDIFAYGIRLEDLGAVESLSRIKLFWPDNPHPSRKEYILYRGPNAKGPFKEIARFPAQGKKKKTSFIDKDILPNISYYYKYSLTTLHGLETPQSEYIKAKTNNAPMSPTGIKARGNMLRRIELSWNPNPEPEVDGYKIYRSFSINGSYQLIGKVDEDRLAYIDQKELKDDTTYYYKVSAFYDRKHESKLSEPVAVTTKGVPSPPAGLTAKSNLFRKVVLTWNVHSDTEIIGYNIYRGLSLTRPSKFIGKVSC